MSAELASLRKRVRLARRTRALFAVAMVLDALTLAISLAKGDRFAALMLALAVAAFTVNLALQTATLRRLRRQEAQLRHELRPRVDWAAVRRMEIEVYGHAFDHPGAPDVAPEPRRHTTRAEDGERYCHEHGCEHRDGGW